MRPPITTASRASPFAAEAGHWQAPYGLYLVRIDTEQRNGVAASWWEFGSHLWTQGVAVDSYYPGHRAHLFTERPIYRPGEIVHYRGVIRMDDDAFYGIPGADTSFTFTVRGPRNRVLFSIAPELNELGSFSVDAMLPDNAHTGTYRVSLTDAGGRDVADTAFAVEEFRVPEFKVDLSSADSDYVAGDLIVAEARASFFFGGAVRDAAVKWSASARPTVIRVDGYRTTRSGIAATLAGGATRGAVSWHPARRARTPRVLADSTWPRRSCSSRGQRNIPSARP